MTDKNYKAKQSLIQQLRDVAEKETAWLEKNRLLYTQKREQLESLVKERGLTVDELAPKRLHDGGGALVVLRQDHAGALRAAEQLDDGRRRAGELDHAFGVVTCIPEDSLRNRPSRGGDASRGLVAASPRDVCDGADPLDSSAARAYASLSLSEPRQTQGGPSAP